MIIKLATVIASAIIVLLINLQFVSFEWFGVLFGVIIVSGLLYKNKKLEKMGIAANVAIFLAVTVAYSFYFTPALSIAKGQGTILSDNWFSALMWLHDNTPECTVIATYWDPGHFIAGIARRPVVFDGASQGATRTVEINGTTVIASRIQDIATTLLTSDEDQALDILRKYRNPNCNEMYYIASQDLLSKSVWWSYFSTWDPSREGEKGDKYSYAIVPRGQSRPLLDQNAIAHIYPLSQEQAFVIVKKDGDVQAFIQQGSNLGEVQKLFYFTKDGQGALKTSSNPQLNGMIWLSPDDQAIIFAPPELENSLFTRMYLFNGAGLENFEFVNSWGGEVKLFKVKFKDEPPTDVNKM